MEIAVADGCIGADRITIIPAGPSRLVRCLLPVPGRNAEHGARGGFLRGRQDLVTMRVDGAPTPGSSETLAPELVQALLLWREDGMEPGGSARALAGGRIDADAETPVVHWTTVLVAARLRQARHSAECEGRPAPAYVELVQRKIEGGGNPTEIERSEREGRRHVHHQHAEQVKTARSARRRRRQQLETLRRMPADGALRRVVEQAERLRAHGEGHALGVAADRLENAASGGAQEPLGPETIESATDGVGRPEVVRFAETMRDIETQIGAGTMSGEQADPLVLYLRAAHVEVLNAIGTPYNPSLSAGTGACIRELIEAEGAIGMDATGVLVRGSPEGEHRPLSDEAAQWTGASLTDDERNDLVRACDGPMLEEAPSAVGARIRETLLVHAIGAGAPFEAARHAERAARAATTAAKVVNWQVDPQRARTVHATLTALGEAAVIGERARITAQRFSDRAPFDFEHAAAVRPAERMIGRAAAATASRTLEVWRRARHAEPERDRAGAGRS